jgi:redox-sensitive bicupin YhaK (pirin superfamily)
VIARRIKHVYRSKPTIEGAGVHLRRAFGYHQVPRFDPFLMLDDFHSSDPSDYMAGFPWHPHRGIETITYVIDGLIEHRDSMGNAGTIGSGDVQWMTAGSGIIHQEMPKRTESGRLWGMQLWANLPASKKMMPPRYRDVKATDIPEVTVGNARVKIISGEIGRVKGPVTDIVTDPEFLDVTVPAKTTFTHEVKPGHTVFAYVLDGEGDFGEKHGPQNVILYGQEGDGIEVRSGEKGMRFLLVSGKPLGEPVAWEGPIVMNTQEELREAFREYEEGRFVK